MCRSHADGGRRCPTSHLTGPALAAHNERRRRARRWRNTAVQAALDLGIPPGDATALRKADAAIVRHLLALTRNPADTTRVMVAIATQGHTTEERDLLEGTVIADHPPQIPGINDVAHIWFDNGTDAYHKPLDGLEDVVAIDFGHRGPDHALHEVAAYRVAQALGPPWAGLVPTCVLRMIGGRFGSLASARPGTPWCAGADDPSRDLVDAAAFLDYLVGQQDRHAGNVLATGDRLALIDNGFAFPRSGDLVLCSELLTTRIAAGRAALTPAERHALHQVLSSPDVHGAGNLLAPDRVITLRERVSVALSADRLAFPLPP